VQGMKSGWKTRPDLLKLIPQWAVGCRRPSPAPGYIEALTKDNVQVITNKIDYVSENGLVVDGNLIEVDAIVSKEAYSIGASRYSQIGRPITSVSRLAVGFNSSCMGRQDRTKCKDAML
jgi:cation diffusion facilitator CzcD-associated flavoprotein CzcO